MGIHQPHRCWLLASGLDSELLSSIQTTLTEPVTTIRAIVEELGKKHRKLNHLLGGDSTLYQSQIISWQLWAFKGTNAIEQFLELNEVLKSKSFLVGHQLTLADICCYWHLASSVNKFFPGPVSDLCNFVRWFDTVQYQIKSLFCNILNVDLMPPLISFVSIYLPLQAPILSIASTTSSVGGSDDAMKENQTGKDNNGKNEKSSKSKEENGKNKKDNGKGKENAKKEKKETGKESSSSSDEVSPNFLELKVGIIVKAWKHPEAEKLYCEEIDLGEESGPRTICSGLRPFYADEAALMGQRVIVVCNLKPRTMIGVKSNGMVVCCSNQDHTSVELLNPPESAKIGDRIIVSGDNYQAEPLAPGPVGKKKILETIMPDWKTNADCIACYKDAPFVVAGTDTMVKGRMPNASVG